MSPVPRAEFDLAHTYRGIPLGHTLPVRPTVLAYLEDHAINRGNDPFITAVSDAGHAVTLSYRDLYVFSGRMACWIQREIGVRPGDVVALLPANDVASVVVIFGVLRSGGAVLFLNPADPIGRLRQQVEAVTAKAVLRVPVIPVDALTDAILVPEPSTLAETLITDPGPTPESLGDALLFGTSGSTAASKLVAQSHYNAVVNAEALRRHHNLKRGDQLLGCLPIHHVNCLHFTIFATLVSGAHAILAAAFDPFSYPQLIEKFRPRIASVVPSILEALLGTWRRPVLPREFDYFVSAAAALTSRTARTVEEKIGARILQGYGLTETTNFSTKMPADLTHDAYRKLVLEAEIPSIGTAIYGNEVTVLRGDGSQAAPGEIGEICMRGHNVMMRYVGNDASTSEAFRDGWFHSQDLGFAIEEGENGGRYFVITGRTKNIAKVRGESVSLDEMDRVLRAHSQIQDVACVALQHRILGEEIIAAVVCSKEVSDSDLRAHLRAAFAATALPRLIVRLDAIPRTRTGKVLRPELTRQLVAQGYRRLAQ